MPYAYISVTLIKGTGALNIDGTAYDTRLRQVIENVSDQVNRFCNRRFQPITGTFNFGGDNTTLLTVRDLISIGSLREDDNNDGTFDTIWGTADYLLFPANAQPTESWGRPYTAIIVNPKSTGTQDKFMPGPERYQIVGTWGYSQILTTAAPVGSGSLGSTATSYPVSTVGIEPGQTILVDSEQMYVRETASSTLTVTRAINGSTAGTHATTATIQTYGYPGPISEACFIQAARLWVRRNSGFANQIGIPDTGVIQVWRGGLDPDVKELLWPYRRLK